jgi:hypothetical protein
MRNCLLPLPAVQWECERKVDTTTAASRFVCLKGWEGGRRFSGDCFATALAAPLPAIARRARRVSKRRPMRGEGTRGGEFLDAHNELIEAVTMEDAKCRRHGSIGSAECRQRWIAELQSAGCPTRIGARSLLGNTSAPRMTSRHKPPKACSMSVKPPRSCSHPTKATEAPAAVKPRK